MKNLGSPSKNVEDERKNQQVQRRGKTDRLDSRQYKENPEDVYERILEERSRKANQKELSDAYQDSLKGKKDKLR